MFKKLSFIVVYFFAAINVNAWRADEEEITQEEEITSEEEEASEEDTDSDEEIGLEEE